LNFLDENFPEDQRPLLRKWRVPHRQIGRELAGFVVKDADIIPLLHRLPAGRKRRSLEASFSLIRQRFPERILPIDFSIAVEYGDLQARLGPLPVLDTLIGATAIVNRLTVITRNTSDISRTGAAIHDPWI
jgi:toxin FitB